MALEQLSNNKAPGEDEVTYNTAPKSRRNSYISRALKVIQFRHSYWHYTGGMEQKSANTVLQQRI